MTSASKTVLLSLTLFAVILLGAISPSLASVSSWDQLWSISGDVIDEEGHPLGGVTVNVYVQSSVLTNGVTGEYLMSLKTDEKGVFNATLLEYRPYILVFDKAGYQTNTVNVNLSKAQFYVYDLKDLVLKRSVSLVATTLDLDIHSGEKISIPFTLRNDGAAETILVSAVNSGGYETSVLSQAGQPVRSVYLPTGNTYSLSLKIVAPVNAVDTDVIIHAAGQLMTDFKIHLNVVEAEGDALSCSYPSRNMKPGGAFDFLVSVQNPLFYEETFTLDLEYPSSWEVYLKNDRGENIGSVALGGGEAVTVHVAGSVPSNSMAGVYPLFLKAMSGAQTSDLPLSVAVKGESEKITVTSKYPSQSIQLGKTTVYPITIANPGAEQLVSLQVDGVPDGWAIAFKTKDGRQIKSILVAGNSYEDIDVEVTPSLSSSQNSYEFTVVASGGLNEGRIALDADIVGSFKAGIQVDSLYLQANAGESKMVTVEVTNSGYSPLNNLKLVVTYPDGWEVATSPLKVTTLSPNDKATFVVSVTNPTGTAPKDYVVNVKGVSDQVETTEQVIRVTVNVESSWSIYGIVLLLAAVGCFALLYKKLRRR